MNRALRSFINWCRDEGLTLNLAKTIIVPFKRNSKIDKVKLSLGNTNIELSEEVKYLGVILDKRLE